MMQSASERGQMAATVIPVLVKQLISLECWVLTLLESKQPVSLRTAINKCQQHCMFLIKQVTCFYGWILALLESRQPVN